jgi:hypothetical protein
MLYSAPCLNLSSNFFRHIVHAFVVMLFPAFWATTAFAVPTSPSIIMFSQTKTTHFAQGADVNFAARAPPMAMPKIVATEPRDIAVQCPAGWEVKLTSRSKASGRTITGRSTTQEKRLISVSTLGEKDAIEALSDDGVVEAISVKDAPGFAVGVQWHLEWQ